MLISCPKCHSIYEIPDDLIGKTGKNFHCHACGNLWHAMREDALGYEEEVEETPYIEAIEVNEPPLRNYPANKEFYNVPADTKSGKRTHSSKEIVNMEGDKNYVPPASKDKKEITLTSDYGTSFTINAMPEHVADEKKTPRLYDEDAAGMHADKENRLTEEKPFKGYPKTKCFIFLLCLAALTVFLRRDVVAVYPEAEEWYNKIYLSGLHNPEYLRFENVKISEKMIEQKPHLVINAEVVNPSRFNTFVPPITLSNSDEIFAAEQDIIKAHSRFSTEIVVPVTENNSQSLTLGFKRP